MRLEAWEQFLIEHMSMHMRALIDANGWRTKHWNLKMIKQGGGEAVTDPTISS